MHYLSFRYICHTTTSDIFLFLLKTQLVEKPFVELAKKLEKERGMVIRYGMVRGQNPLEGDYDEEFLLEENPSVVLIEFAKLMGFRPMDLLSAFDKDKSNTLDRHEIKMGLRVRS